MRDRARGIRFGAAGDPTGLPAFVNPESTVVIADELTKRYLPQKYAGCPLVIVPRGEPAKSLTVLETVYRVFLEVGVGRDWTVLAMGGGSVTDLAGFAASTWLRGIDFGFMPTTLLAMVDASVGGKNGINYRGYKNLVGCFAQPRFILVDVSALSDLGDEAFACGLAEAIKHAIIDGPAHLELLEAALRSGERPNAANLECVIRSSIELKSRIADADERESGDRMRLNLGHTVGHAVEAVTGLPHGACVSVGIIAAFSLAIKLAHSEEEAAIARRDALRITGLLSSLGLPVSLEEARLAGATAPMDAKPFREAIAHAIETDKKRRGDSILFALPRSIGTVDIQSIATKAVANFIGEAP